MGPAEKRRYPGDVKAPGDKKEDVFYFIFYSVQGPWFGSFKGGMSLTLVTFFFETSKPQANIYYALVGLECQA